jgi:hypothetical protein
MLLIRSCGDCAADGTRLILTDRLASKSKLLYICDAYHGIFTLHVDTMQVKHIVPVDAPSKGTQTTQKAGMSDPS